VSAGSWYEVDVTGLVTSSGTVGIRMNSSDTNGADYSSRENSNGNAAELVVTTSGS